jgi:hypothetical protein
MQMLQVSKDPLSKVDVMHLKDAPLRTLADASRQGPGTGG